MYSIYKTILFCYNSIIDYFYHNFRSLQAKRNLFRFKSFIIKKKRQIIILKQTHNFTLYTGDFMNKKFVEKFTAVVSAVCMISVGIASVNAAEIDDGFESVTKNAQSSDSSFPSAYSAIGYSLVDENGLPSNFSSKISAL